MIKVFRIFPRFAGVMLLLASCHKVDNERIPNMPVYINLSNPGLWNTWGVAGFGDHRNFILGSEPKNFNYVSNSATGFGGVLLIEGLDPYNSLGAYPLAYDLACPVERKADIRVRIDNDNYVAYCPQCKSTYDVTMGGGAPISGEAARGKHKYSLKTYMVVPTTTGGFNITN